MGGGGRPSHCRISLYIYILILQTFLVQILQNKSQKPKFTYHFGIFTTTPKTVLKKIMGNEAPNLDHSIIALFSGPKTTVTV